MGRSNCEIPTHSTLTGQPLTPNEINTFLCDESEQQWITEEGWNELLRQYTTAANILGSTEPSWTLLWIYIPDYTLKGKMNTIVNVPKSGKTFDINDPDPFWTQTHACAGAVVSDDCQWRYEEMSLVTFTPIICSESMIKGCEELVAYARINISYSSRMEAIFQFCTTIFTCCILAMAFIVFSNDTERIVIKPIQKIVEII